LRRWYLGLEIAAFGTGGGQRGFFEGDPEEFAALAALSGAVPAGGLVVARAASRPGREMPGGGEDRHVGADLSDHRLSGAGGDAGDGGGQRDGRLPGRAQFGLDRLRQFGDVLIEEVQVREDRADDQRVMGLKAALQGLSERGQLLRNTPPARTSGSVVPATSASSIARPETPRMSVATQSSLIPVSSSALRSRLASRWRSAIWVLRYRVSCLSARIALGGTKLARNSPASSSWHSHSA